MKELRKVMVGLISLLVFFLPISHFQILNANGASLAPDNSYYAEYFNNMKFAGDPVFTKIEESIDHNWGTSSPGQGIDNDFFSVRWTGQFDFEKSTYSFRYKSDDGIRVWLDDFLIIDDWNVRIAEDIGLTIPVKQGKHKIICEYFDKDVFAVIYLKWNKIQNIDIPDTPFYAEYFNNLNLVGDPVFTQIEEKINYNWRESSPGHGVNKDKFSVRWTGRFEFDKGIYSFHYNVDDGIRVWLDDKLMIDEWHDQVSGDLYNQNFVSQGSHKIKCEYYDHGNGAHVLLEWTKLPKETKVLPILIEFPDQLHKFSPEEMYSSFFSTKTFKEDPKNFISVRNFVKEVTNETYDFVPGSYGVGKWIKMPKTKEYYRNPMNYLTFFDDLYLILEKLNIDSSEYDQDKNGAFDFIIFLCAGERDYGVFGWSWGYTSSKVNGLKVGQYYMTGETQNGEKQPFIRNICAKYYLYLGGVYLLSFEKDCKVDPVGPWDFMGLGGKWTTFGLSGFSRNILGWLDEDIIDQSGTYEISALCTNSPKRLYRINIPNTSEYFLIENRYLTGSDSWWKGIPNQGLVIYHVDGSIPLRHGFNDGPPKYEHFAVLVENADPKMTYCKEKNLTEFTPKTNPNSKDYYDKSSSEISIVNISKFGPTMTFDVIINNREKPPQPIIKVNPERFDLGEVKQNSVITKTISVENSGTGVLDSSITSLCPYISFNKKDSKDNKTSFTFNIDTSKKTNSFVVDYINIESNGGSKKILVNFRIVARIGDFNNDGRTNIDDFKILLDAFGSKVGDATYNELADFNSDGKIDVKDLVTFAQNYEL